MLFAPLLCVVLELMADVLALFFVRLCEPSTYLQLLIMQIAVSPLLTSYPRHEYPLDLVYLRVLEVLFRYLSRVFLFAFANSSLSLSKVSEISASV